jgi:hypothetical protein
MNKNSYSKTTLCLILAGGVLATPGFAVITTNWTGADSGDRFQTSANWDNGVPEAGWTANVGGTSRVEIGSAGELAVGATINMNDSSFIERNSISNTQFSDTLNFNDNSALITSELRMSTGHTLNWNSTGSWTSAGQSPSANFTPTGGVANMSAGSWILAGNDNTDSYNARGDHVFNMTGGTMALEHRMRIGQTTPATFNLGANASLYIDSLFMNVEDSLLNFQPGATLHIVSIASFDARLVAGFLAIDGIVTTESSDFIFGDTVTQDFGFGEITYTPISAIPEPQTYAIWAGILAAGVLLLRSRRKLKDH